MDFRNAELKTGIEVIDRVHEDLVRLAKMLQRAVAEGSSADQVAAVLEEFEAYAREDFQHEETRMLETGYPGYAAHKSEHDALAVDIVHLKRALQADGPSSALAIHLQRRIREWLISHLNQADVQLSAYLKTQR